MVHKITSRKFEGHTEGYRAKVTLGFIAKFINKGDTDLQTPAERTSKDCDLQEFIEYISKIIEDEDKRLHRKKTGI